MSETSTLAAAAAQAASAGDIPAAAALLQRTLELQERTLGPEHREIATTLNNLALMLERLDQVNEAGRCYRRAYVVAKKALGPDDPAVQVSRANLAAFVEEHGAEASELATSAGHRSPQDNPSPSTGLAGVFASDDIWETSVPGAAAGRTTPVPAAEPAPAGLVARRTPERAVVGPTFATADSSPSPADRQASAPADVVPPNTSGGRSSVSPWWALVAAAALVVLAGWYTFTPDGGEASAPPAAEAVDDAGPSSPPAPSSPAASSTAPPGSSMSAGAANVSPTETPSPPAAPSTPAGAPAPRTTLNEVADAVVCASLTRSPGVWRCEPTASPALGRAVYYYTRVRSPRDGSIRHRWVHNGNLVAERTLRIQANPTYGFRTFTRQTLSQPGEWQVLLIGMDGTALDERSFYVR